MGDYTDQIYGRLRIINTGDSYVRKSDEDIEYIRAKIDEFLGYVRTPAKVLSWCFTAMAAGILGEIGFKLFKWVSHLGGR
jgi:hypothetical protein